MEPLTPPIKRPRLGRGLDAILPAVPTATGRSAAIEDLYPNRDQPRKRFDENGIRELAESIRELGILEPILVRKRAAGGFEIVAGERRWRAAQKAGLRDVPILVRDFSSEEALEAALVENIQREDLNPTELARAFQRLIDEHQHTQDSVASRVGRDRTTVANALRLLKLPDPVLKLLETRELSEGHGRALLGCADPAAMIALAARAIDQGWNVRETERQARRIRSTGARTNEPTRSANVRDLEARLSRTLGTTVRVVDRKGRGRLEISFSSYDELDRILEVIGGQEPAP
jgi:ParB family chromosome partitioning protein